MAPKEKVYVAAKYERKEEVRKIYAALRARGYEIAYDWTNHIKISDFRQNMEMGQQYAEEDTVGVLNSNILILLPANTTQGANNELGIATLAHRLFGKPSRIYIVEEEGVRFGPFYVRKEVILKKTIDDVLKELDVHK